MQPIDLKGVRQASENLQGVSVLTPLVINERLSNDLNCKIYLKREDLLHGGAHKTNQVLGQALLAKRMGKTEIIAETGAGQHGVATAIACSLLGVNDKTIQPFLLPSS